MAGMNEEAVRKAKEIAADSTLSQQERIVRLELLATAHEIAGAIAGAMGKASARLAISTRSLDTDEVEPGTARVLTAFANDLHQFDQWSATDDGQATDAVKVLRALGFKLDWLD
jgi:hypothetical protein